MKVEHLEVIFKKQNLEIFPTMIVTILLNNHVQRLLVSFQVGWNSSIWT